MPALVELRLANAKAHLALDPDVGSALLDAADRWATEHGISNLSAGIHHRNASAVRFYRRHGDAPSGTSWIRRPAD